MALEAPPNQSFDTQNEAIQFLRDWGRDHGFGVAIKRSIKDRHGIVYKVNLRCDKGRKFTSTATKKESSTRMTECPFQATVKKLQQDDEWTVTCDRPEHNHEPSDTPATHPSLRKPTTDELDIITSLTSSNIRPKAIIAHLRQNDPTTLLTRQEVYNYRQKHKSEQLGGLTPIEALVKRLTEDSDWALDYSTNGVGAVTRLFFAYKPAIQLAKAYPEILLADATYRTNRYNMPLLHFMGVTPLESSFSIAFCFLSAEDEVQYKAAIRAFKTCVWGSLPAPIEAILTDDERSLKKAFALHFPHVPQLLCVWHVNKNLLVKAQKTWRVDSRDDELNKENEKLRKEFMSRWSQASYCINCKTLLSSFAKPTGADRLLRDR
jgi:hypothetical protein